MSERPGSLQAATETETDEGGRTRVWAEVAVVWVEVRAGAGSSDASDGLRPVRVDTATAVARDHPAAAAGQQLVLDSEAPWRVLAVRRGEPAAGRMTLVIDWAG